MMAEKNKIMEILQRPFPAEDIEWRIAQCGMKKDGQEPWAKVLAYITARAVHERLDEAFGIFGWRNEFREFTVPGGEAGIICRIEFRDPETGEWCWKENGAPQTGYEPFKGGLSDSEKRTFAELGGGRYLYKLTANWAIIALKKSDATPYYQPAKSGDGGHCVFWWGPPQLPAFALPQGARQKATPSSEGKGPEEGDGEQPEAKEPIVERDPTDGKDMPVYPNVQLPPEGTKGLPKIKELIGLAQSILKMQEEEFITWYKDILHKDLSEANMAQATLLLQKMKDLTKGGKG